MPFTSRLNVAFSDWLRIDVDRFDRLWCPPEFSETGVKLSLKRFAPHAVAYLNRNNADLAVEWECEVWDFLIAFEVSPVRGPSGGWLCGLCLGDLPEFDTLDALWRDHLFEPLATWIEQRLMTSDVLHLSMYKGCTWVTAAERNASPGKAARYAIFAVPEPR